MEGLSYWLPTSFIIVFAGGTLLVMLYNRFTQRPRIKAYFPDGSTSATYRANKEVTVNVHLKNQGSVLRLGGVVATDVSLWTCFPLNFTIKEVRCGGHKDTRVLEAPRDGILRDTQYIQIYQAFVLFKGEVSVVNIDVKTPSQTGSYTVLMPIVSEQGDLGVKKLKIIIM